MPNAKTKLRVLTQKAIAQTENTEWRYWAVQKQIAEKHLAKIKWH